jgi:hypothetical protein
MEGSHMTNLFDFARTTRPLNVILVPMIVSLVACAQTAPVEPELTALPVYSEPTPEPMLDETPVSEPAVPTKKYFKAKKKSSKLAKAKRKASKKKIARSHTKRSKSARKELIVAQGSIDNTPTMPMPPAPPLMDMEENNAQESRSLWPYGAGLALASLLVAGILVGRRYRNRPKQKKSGRKLIYN